MRGLVPNPYIDVSVSDLYISTNGLPILLQQYRWTDRGNIYVNRSQKHECMDIGNEIAQSSFWEYINRIFFAVWTEHLLSPIHQHRGLIWICPIDPPSPFFRFPTSPTSGRIRTWPWVWWSPPCGPPPRPAPSPRNSLSPLQNAPVKIDTFYL